MKKQFAYILMLFCVAAASLSCGNSERLIPRSKMSKIYADMFIADQWLISNYQYRAKADTTQFYDIVLEKYGYDSKDFRYSMDYYLQDPLRYARMLKKTTQILESQRNRLSIQVDAERFDPGDPELLKEESPETQMPGSKKHHKKEIKNNKEE